MEYLINKLQKAVADDEFKRLFHGRGEKECRHITVDSIGDLLFVQFYSEYDKESLSFFKEYGKSKGYKTVVVKERFANNTFALVGEVPKEHFALERGMKFRLNFFNQNIGYFGDMKNSREYIEKISENKKVLNLFAYTCGFSLFARRGGAKYVANVDMSKSSLAVGMANHRINSLDVKDISFWPYNILKAFGKLKKHSPYDIIIIDPPTFQKGSFSAKSDYIKIIKKLHTLSHENTTLLSCINSPSFTKEELASLVEQNSSFRFKEMINPPREYTNSSLKSLVFSQ